MKVNIILSEQKEPMVTHLEKNESFGNVEALTGQVKRHIENVQGMAKQGQTAHETERTLLAGRVSAGA
ncbi:MAG: hypothetical protein ACFCVA_00365 [Gammaproteobacteria bacterium]